MMFKNDWLLHSVIPHYARLTPDRIAVISKGSRLTWAELNEKTNQVGNALIARGMKKGDKVALFLSSDLPAYVLMWGIIRAGGVVVALNTMMTGDTLGVMIENSEATFLFAEGSQSATLPDVVDRMERSGSIQVFRLDDGAEPGAFDNFVASGSKSQLDVVLGPDDSINIVYTSGSTGVPKGVEHSHIARHNYTFGIGHWLNFDRDSVALLATPLYTNGTWITMAPCMFRGGTCVLMPKFDAGEFLRLIEEHKCTHSFLVPTQIARIVNDASIATCDTSSFRILVSAGQALMASLFDEITEKMPATSLWECYGMSEGFGTLIGPQDYKKGKRGSVGMPFCLDDIRIVGDDDKEINRGEIGEVCGYSVGLMNGYYRDPENTEKSIWYSPEGRSYIRSGDLGRFDDDGYLYLCGRKKDMIKSGGINIWPADIEQIFSQHPAVHEVAVIGVPHHEWIETPMAFVVLRKDHSITERELQDWGNGRLSKYQRVSALRIVDDLPRVTYDKVDKKTLRTEFWPAHSV